MTAYAHQHNNTGWNPKRGTIAINLPTKKDLEALFTAHGTCTLINLGAARLKDGEPFVKKDGRDYAQSMMNYQKANLASVEIRDTKHIYHFLLEVPSKCPEDGGKQVIVLGLSTVSESDHVCLVYAHFPNMPKYDDDAPIELMGQ